jgi:hypothetical protein
MSKFKTFKEITWEPHQVGNGAIQGLLVLDNGIELSIVAGQGMYSTPREDLGSPDLYSSFEVAIFDENGDMVDDVLGWQSNEDIDKLIQIHS